MFNHSWPGDSCVGRTVVLYSHISYTSWLEHSYMLFLLGILGTREIHVV